MRKLILAAALLLCAAVPATAQDEPSPGEMEAVREFLDVMRMRENMALTMEAMLGNGLGDDMPPGFTDVMRTFFAEHLRYENLEPGFIRMYTDLFTEEELRALVAFYRTPVGQRMVELTPEIAVRTQQITSEIMEEAMPELMELMMRELEDDFGEEKAPPPPPRKS
jgi:hypothetical protein